MKNPRVTVTGVEVSFTMTSPTGHAFRVWIAKMLLRLAGWLCSTKVTMELDQ